MKKYIALIIAALAVAPIAKAQEQTIPTVAPRSYHLDRVNGQVVYVLDTFTYPSFFTTQREKDSIRVLDFTELLQEEHLWLAHHIWRSDSTDGIYYRNAITRNEVNLHQVDSVFTARYGNRYTSR